MKVIFCLRFMLAPLQVPPPEQLSEPPVALISTLVKVEPSSKVTVPGFGVLGGIDDGVASRYRRSKWWGSHR